jgi:hypothetical protein
LFVVEPVVLADFLSESCDFFVGFLSVHLFFTIRTREISAIAAGLMKR